MKKLLLVALLLLTSCKAVEEKPEVNKPVFTIEEQLDQSHWSSSRMIEQPDPRLSKEYQSASTLVSTESNSNGLAMIYDYETTSEAKEIRMYVLVDGYPVKHSLNPEESSYVTYYEHQKDLNIQINKDDLELSDDHDAIIASASILTDDSIPIVDSAILYYHSTSLGVDGVVNSSYTANKEDFNLITPTFSKVLNLEEDNKIRLIHANAETSTVLSIVTENQIYNTVGMNGFVYDESRDFFINKIGKGDTYVYPLVNGEYIKDGGKILGFFFEDTDDLLSASYAPFDMKSLGIKHGDIITMLVWSGTMQAGSAYIPMELLGE